YAAEYDFMGQRLKMRVLDYIPSAQDSLVASSTGKNILHLVTLIEGKRENKYIPSASVQVIQNMLVSYNEETPGAVNIQEEAGNLVINSAVGGGYMIMASQEKGELQAERKQPFHLRSLYTLGSLTFVIPQAPSKGEIIHFEGDKRTHENEADLV